jgi:DNA-binding SARP family transcriptional activator/predicted ATPase
MHALVAYLVLHPDAPQSRQQIAACFWPDVPEAQGRNTLRQLIHQLRQAWPDHEELISSDARSMQWRGGARAQVDVIELQRETAVAGALRGNERRAARETLARVVRGYAGDLLPDCYDEWILPHRDRLRTAVLGALDLLLKIAEDERDHASAVAHAQHLLQLEPLEERTYLRLMRLHAQSGTHAAGLRVYDSCVAMLRRELGVAPGAEIREAHQRLLQRGPAQLESRPISSRERMTSDRPAALVGRGPELRQLQEAWRQVQPVGAILVLVTGEAGLGKTRLGEEMLRWADAEGIAVARTRAYAAEGRLALSPIAGWLRSESVRDSLGRLHPLWRTEVARLIPELLVEQPELPRPPPLAEYWQRQQFFEALARAITGAAPALVLLLDDLQWCDAETLEWLHFLLRFTADMRLLVVGTVRSDEVDARHPLGRLSTALRRSDQLVEIPLAPLDAAETAKLACDIAGEDVDSDAVFRIFSQTEGNPLFVVESVRAGLPPVRALGDAPASPTLPPKVHSVITGRLNQLSPGAREVAGLAATIGRAFSVDVLSRASDLDELRVAHALDELWQRRIVRDGGADAHGARETWDFTHDRLREVAAAEVSPIQRQRHHRRIAEALERAYAEDLDSVSASIASHYDQAREAVLALPYYERAAKVAMRVFAFDEVQKLLRRALSLLDRHPEASRPALELRLQVALAEVITVTDGWAAPGLEAVHARVVELSRAVGDPEQQVAALLNSVFFCQVSADFRRVTAMLVEVRAAMHAVTSLKLQAMAATAEVGACISEGHFPEAEAIYQGSKGIYDPGHDWMRLDLAQGHPGVLMRAWSSHGLWCQGHVDAALERCHDALTLAQAHASPFGQAVALSYLSILHQLNGDADRTRALASEAHATSDRHHLLYYRAWAGILLAWADASAAPTDAALLTLRQRIDEFTATGGRLRLPYYLSLLAGLEAKGGASLAALRTLDEALEISALAGDAWWDAEMHRMRGELLQRENGRDVEATAAFERAVAIAREQGAAMLEQRAVDSLAKFVSNALSNAGPNA